MAIENLAQFKRALTVGSTWRSVWKCGPQEGLILHRKVAKVQTNGVQFEPHVEGKQGSWLFFQKASDYEFSAGLIVAHDGRGRPFATYEHLSHQIVDEDFNVLLGPFTLNEAEQELTVQLNLGEDVYLQEIT